MVDLGAYEFTDLEAGKIKPEESFMNAYAESILIRTRPCSY